MLNYYDSDVYLEEKDLDDIIEIFLLCLRTYTMEASLCLSDLLDSIWRVGKIGNQWSCIKRVNGILASVYLLYFSSKAKLFDEQKTKENMKKIFANNTKFYTEEDKRFLSQIFMMEGYFDCVVILLESNLVIYGKEEKITVNSENILIKEFFNILKRLKIREHYEDALVLFKESECLFNKTSIHIKECWEKEKAGVLFHLGKYEETKNILDKYANRFNHTEDVYDLYNDAINYAWAANFKEKDDHEWKNYIEKANNLIMMKAEDFILQPDNRDKYEKSLYDDIILEKSFLLSENEKYNEAYEKFKQAFLNADDKTRRNSNFNTHFWILMKYMCKNPEKEEVVLEWINTFYERYNSKLNEYETIVKFMNTNEYITCNHELYHELYVNLLKLHFHALEIRHETKILLKYAGKNLCTHGLPFTIIL